MFPDWWISLLVDLFVLFGEDAAKLGADMMRRLSPPAIVLQDVTGEEGGHGDNPCVLLEELVQP